MDLKGKCVLLGVTGGIAAYKMANVASALRKLGADVEVIMTKNATQFITPITFETLTGHKCMVDTFDRDFKFEVTHISLAKKADVILVAPATANVIAKMAHGIADDMLTTVVLAAKCPKLVSPAMNTGIAMQNLLQFGIQFGLFDLNPPQVIWHKTVEQNTQTNANQQQTAFIFQHGQRYTTSCHVMRCQDGIDGDGIFHAAGKTNQ